MLYKLVLLENVTAAEAEGWRRVNQALQAHVFLGGWPSVYMWKKGE